MKKDTQHLEEGMKMKKGTTEIKIQFTYYYYYPVTLDHLKEMIPVTQSNYDGADDVWKLPHQIFLRSARDGRFYSMNRGKTDQEYRCIIAQEYHNDEPYEGVILGFVPV